MVSITFSPAVVEDNVAQSQNKVDLYSSVNRAHRWWKPYPLHGNVDSLRTRVDSERCAELRNMGERKKWPWALNQKYKGAFVLKNLAFSTT